MIKHRAWHYPLPDGQSGYAITYSFEMHKEQQEHARSKRMTNK